MDKTTGIEVFRLVLPYLAMIISPLVVKAFRWMGVSIDNSEAEDLLLRIVNICVNTDNGSLLKGPDKKAIVADEVERVFSKKELGLLKKKYGSVEAAVEAAFQRSNLAKK